MFVSGRAKPEFEMAVETRSFASFTAVSGRPTIANCGDPLEAHTSISTVRARTPATAPE